MVVLNLGNIEFAQKSDLINTLNEVADMIENGYRSGITIGGVCWDIDGDEEFDEEFYNHEQDDDCPF